MRIELQELLDDCSNEIDDIESKINELSPFDKMRSYLTKYSLIKVSGTIEFVYKSIIADYFEQYNVPQISFYLDTKVRKGSFSAKYEVMYSQLAQFDKKWADTFKCNIKNRPDGDQLISASNSLVTNRHSFAHGKEPTATFNDIKQYYQNMVQLLNEFDEAVR